MRRSIHLVIIVAVTLAALISCKPKYEKPSISKGEIDPTRFVMIGGGHVAGYMNDALYYEGQQNSLAALISSQLEKVGGTPIYQPFVNASSVGIGLTGLSQMKLGYKTDCKGNTSLSPIRVASVGDLSIFNDNLFSTNNRFGNYVLGLKMYWILQNQAGQQITSHQ